MFLGFVSFGLLLRKVKVMKRHKIGKGKSKRMFSKHADLTHKKNVQQPNRTVMRGGIRL